MKNFYFIVAAILILLMLTLPFLSMTKPTETVSPPPTENNVQTDETDENIVLLCHADGQLKTLNMREYIFGVVAAEISMSYEIETIKAQTVAAFTYTLYKRSKNKAEDYDITDNPNVDQAYITVASAKEKWGEKAAEYEKKLNDVLDQVYGTYLCYNDQPIYAAYHAISSGKTEKSQSVWGNELPYLAETESMGDLLSPDYLSEKSVSAEEFRNAFKDICTLPENEAEYIGEIVRSASGGAISVRVGNKQISGIEFRRLLSLRSQNFDVKYTDGVFNFTVRGYGHGVGMSQNGAEYMAAQGSTYTEILNWYYKDCTLKTIK